MSLAKDMDTLASAGDKYRQCVDCSNAYHLSTPDGFLITGHGRCISCERLKPTDKAADRVVNCVSTVEPYVKRDRSTAEQVRVDDVWLDKNDIYYVTLSSSVHQGAIVMKLTDFYLQYELAQNKESNQQQSKALISNRNFYYYVTYSFLVGRQKILKRGYIGVCVSGAKIFNLFDLIDLIKKELVDKSGIKPTQVLIENWIKINEAEYKDLMGDQ